jgi:hypothetical protein
MKVKQIEALESYFKTENEDWNEFTFKMLCEVLKNGEFEKPEIPLQLCNYAIDTFIGLHEKPLKAVEQFARELDKHKLTTVQRLFIYDWVYKYIEGNEFDKVDLNPILELLRITKEKLKKETQSEKPLTSDMRESLKAMFQKELTALPETLSKLEPEKRLSILIKLMPFIIPKLDTISCEKGEPEYERKQNRLKLF